MAESLVQYGLRAALGAILVITTAFATPSRADGTTLPATLAGTTTAPASSGYAVLQKVKIGGVGGWDYLAMDPGANRLYITRQSHLMVLDASTLKVVGDIPNTDGIHGVAIVPNLHRGFTSNGKADTVTVFDTQTLATLATLHTGKKPDAIIYDPASKKVLAFDGGSDEVTIFDPNFDAAHPPEGKTLALGGAPEFAVADGAGKVYVNLEDKSEVVQFDPVALKVLNHWPLAPGEGPTGIAMDTAARRLFIGCANRVMVIMNADTGKVIASSAIGSHVDAARFDPDLRLAFASTGEGILNIVKETSPDVFETLAGVPTQAGARTMALDPKTHRIYLVTAEYQPLAAGQRRPTPVPDSFTVLVVGPAAQH